MEVDPAAPPLLKAASSDGNQLVERPASVPPDTQGTFDSLPAVSHSPDADQQQPEGFHKALPVESPADTEQNAAMQDALAAMSDSHQLAAGQAGMKVEAGGEDGPTLSAALNQHAAAAALVPRESEAQAQAEAADAPQVLPASDQAAASTAAGLNQAEASLCTDTGPAQIGGRDAAVEQNGSAKARIHVNSQADPGEADHESSPVVGQTCSAPATNYVEDQTHPTEAGLEASLAATEVPPTVSFLHTAQATSAATETPAATAIPGKPQKPRLTASLPFPGQESSLSLSNGMPSIDDDSKLAASTIQPDVAVAPVMDSFTPVDVHSVQPKQRVMCPVTGRSFHFGCLPSDKHLHLCGGGPSKPSHDKTPQPGVALRARPIFNGAAPAMTQGGSTAKEDQSSLDQPISARNRSHQAQEDAPQNVSLTLLANDSKGLDANMEIDIGAAAYGTADGAQDFSEPWAESAAAGEVSKGVASIAASGLQPCTLSLGQRAPWGPLRWQLIRGAAVAHPEVLAEGIAMHIAPAHAGVRHRAQG